MNSKFVNFATKSVSVVATAVVLLVSNPVNSFASPVKDKKITQPIDGQVSVKYTGSNAKTVVFHLTFDNIKGETFSLLIKNDVGDVVYQEQFSTVNFDKNIYLDVEENHIHPTFIIQTDDQEVVRSLSVNKRSAENRNAVSKL
ncbi:MAG TPA: hypothetical protein VK543_09990 [Puia sp.]|nr:hypothetical protein [Puia sp.]